MIARPGSFLGFVAHDLKLGARGFLSFMGQRSARAKAIVIIGVLAALHAAAWPLARWLGGWETGPDGEQFLTAEMRAGVIFVLPWVIASPMTSVSRLLFQRGDLDLVLASPTKPRGWLAARLVALAIESVGAVGLLLLPLANVSALQGRVHWLALYPALAASGLLGAGVGLMLALGLFFAVGPRRARVVSQIAATLIGASAVLAAQLLAMLPKGTRESLFDALSTHAGGDALLWVLTLPARAAGGDSSALLAWIALSIAIFAVALVVCGDLFGVAAMRSAGAPSSTGRKNARLRFSAHLGSALRVKEHRLLWRDPWLLSQMTLQVIYTLPIGVMLWRNGGITGSPGIAFGPTLAVIAGQLAGSLAWIALSAEDAPDFIATAPATRGQIERGKLFAIALPVAIVMAPPVAILGMVSPWGGLCTLVAGIGASVCGALLMLWRQAPARRNLVLQRHSQSKLIALVEHWLSLLWAVATGAAVFGSWVCLVPVILATLTLWLLKPAEAPRLAPAAA